MIAEIKSFLKPQDNVTQLHHIVLVLAAALAVLVIGILVNQLWPQNYGPQYTDSDRAALTRLFDKVAGQE